MPRLRVTALARSDLEEIHDYIARDNPTAARKWIARTKKEFLFLAKNPGMGELRSELGENIRSISHGNYVIYSRRCENVLEIVRVLHGARDIRSLH